MTRPVALPHELLAQARGGDLPSLGELLMSYRNYLSVLARSQMSPPLRTRVDPSDVVQEALLEAHRDFAGFAGNSEGELLAWLRRILVRNLLDIAKHHQAQARDLHRQESLEAIMAGSSDALGRALASPGATPSSHAAQREQAVLLADALERLAPDYREVIILRNLQHLPFEEIAQIMGRKPGAVRMLWTRALEKVSLEMGVSP